MVKNLPAMQKTWVGKITWKGMVTRSSILAWEIHGQRSLVGCLLDNKIVRQQDHSVNYSL